MITCDLTMFCHACHVMKVSNDPMCDRRSKKRNQTIGCIHVMLSYCYLMIDYGSCVGMVLCELTCKLTCELTCAHVCPHARSLAHSLVHLFSTRSRKCLLLCSTLPVQYVPDLSEKQLYDVLKPAKVYPILTQTHFGCFHTKKDVDWNQ